MDLDGIRSACKRQLNEPTGADEGYWDDDDYKDVLNDAQKNFAGRTGCLKTDASFTTEASKAMYDLSEASLANFLDIAQIYYYTDTDLFHVLTSVNRDMLAYLKGGQDGVEGVPYHYCYEDRTITFSCDTEVGKTAKVWYYYQPGDVSSGSDVPDVQVKYHPALVDYVCWKFCEADDTKMDKVIYFRDLYIEGVAQAKAMLEPAASSYEHINDVSEIPYV